jgi:hypothetical protein
VKHYNAIGATGESAEIRFVGAIVKGSCHEAEGTAAWISNGSNIDSRDDTCNLSEMSHSPGPKTGLSE